MDEKTAREILSDGDVKISSNNDLHANNPSFWVRWKAGYDEIELDSSFDIEELEAILWWMKNKMP